jgi:hypothetical protein
MGLGGLTLPDNDDEIRHPLPALTVGSAQGGNVIEPPRRERPAAMPMFTGTRRPEATGQWWSVDVAQWAGLREPEQR